VKGRSGRVEGQARPHQGARCTLFWRYRRTSTRAAGEAVCAFLGSARFERVGDTARASSDARIVAATNPRSRAWRSAPGRLLSAPTYFLTARRRHRSVPAGARERRADLPALVEPPAASARKRATGARHASLCCPDALAAFQPMRARQRCESSSPNRARALRSCSRVRDIHAESLPDVPCLFRRPREPPAAAATDALSARGVGRPPHPAVIAKLPPRSRYARLAAARYRSNDASGGKRVAQGVGTGTSH
jgi:hypothetical protein